MRLRMAVNGFRRHNMMTFCHREIFLALLATRKSSQHARGATRRTLLVSAARTLLAAHEMDTISLGDVAKQAGVPVSSAYHFYSDIRDLYAMLLATIQTQLLEEYKNPIRMTVRQWPDVIAILVKKGVEWYATDPAARQLMVGPKTPPDLKLRDRGNDFALGELYERHVDTYFRLPHLENRSKIFFRAVEIIDLMFCLSMMEFGDITQEYTEEAIHAAVGYLSHHMPLNLPRRRA